MRTTRVGRFFAYSRAFLVKWLVVMNTPLVGTAAVQGGDECLQSLPADAVSCAVPLGLDVDALQAEWVLVHEAVDTAISGAADLDAALLGSSIVHGEQQLHNCLFEEVRCALL